MEHWCQLLKILMTNHSLIHERKDGSDALYSLLDPPGLLGSCVCNPQLPSAMCGSAYQAHFKKDDTGVKSIFSLLSSTEFLLKNIILRMIYPIKKEVPFALNLKYSYSI